MKHFFLLRTRLMTLYVLTLATLPAAASAQTLKDIVVRVFVPLVNPAIAIVSGGALAVFGWGLVKFISKAGDETAHKEGKQVMVWGLIALFVFFSFWGFILLGQQTIFGGALKSPAPF